MKKTVLPVIIILTLHKGLLGEISCGENQFLSGTIGGQVTLSLDEINFLYIYWATPNKFVAETLPGEGVGIQNNEYEGRLSATAKGSLIIKNLTREDQDQYTANVQMDTSVQCLLRFDLRVFGPMSVKSCAGQTNITSVEGGEVTLPVNQTGLESITWMTLRDLVHLAVTKPGKSVLIQDARYAKRLKVTANGSLIITGLAREDQGIYGTYAVTSTSHKCAQLYNLRVTDFRERDYAAMNKIRLGISAFVFLMTCCLFIHHMKTEVMGPSTNT
ncbi:uncharacterized protein [Pyxicephalus adspersus]|uniref:uncharacterized protein n=1 Tax=Pyxicephalus adspersus TaxID=30357 RepID=UPI003B5BD512